MTDRKPSPTGRPVDLATVRADDLLLDALGRGEAGPADDELAAMLASWHSDLDTGLDADLAADLAADRIPDLVPEPIRDPVPALPGPAEAPPAGDSVTQLLPVIDTSHRPDRLGRPDRTGRTGRRRWRPGAYRLVAAGALVVAVAGGVGVAAAAGTPNSPLWPITKVVNPDRANTLAAEDDLSQARQAIAAGHYADARRLLNLAAGLIARVPDQKEAARLRAEWAGVAAMLPATTTPGAPTPATSGGPTAAGTATPTTGNTPAPGAAPTAGGPTQAGSPTPTQPPGLLPSLPLPLPTGILHSLLPSLIP
jgi:hypothetical protein